MTETQIYKPELGIGVYTVPDIALILRLPLYKVRHYIKDFWDNRIGKEANIKYSNGIGRNRTVNFYTLIEFFTFYQLRENKISTYKIISAHNVIAESLKTLYPFATSTILTDKSSIFYSTDDESIINADRSAQYNLREVLLPFCEKIDFGKEKLAERFWPQGRDNSVCINPHHKFGQPVIEGTNIAADILYNLYKGGEKPDFIASLYDLKIKQIKDAIAFCTKAA